MTLDILAAIEATEPAPASGMRCVIGRFLDSIPNDAPGKDQLVAILATRDRNDPNWRPLDQIDALLIRLGQKTSPKSTGDHRGGRCRCNR